MRNKVHGSDKYWRNRRSHKSSGNYNFGPTYVCRNDGRCYYDKCIYQHFKQDAPSARNNWEGSGRHNYRSGGGHGARRKWSRSRSPSLSYGQGRSRSRERNYRSFSRSRSRSPRGDSKEDYDRYETELMIRSRDRMSRSHSRERHMNSDWVDMSSRRAEGNSRSHRSLSLDMVGSPYPERGREGMLMRSMSRERSWSHSPSRSRGRARHARSRSGSSRRGGTSRSGSRTRDERSRSGSRGRMGRGRSGSRERQGNSRSDYSERQAWIRRDSDSRERIDRDRIGWSRSGSRGKLEERSRSGSRGIRSDSRSNSREMHWRSRSGSAQSRSPSTGGRRKGERYLPNSPDVRRETTEIVGTLPAAGVESSYATFAAYPSSSTYVSNPSAYSSASYADPNTFPSSGYPGGYLYPPASYSASYPTTSTLYAASSYENSHQNESYPPQYDRAAYSSQPVNQEASSSESSSSSDSSESPDSQEGKKERSPVRDQEEAGDEVNDTYGKSMIRSLEASISDALMEGIQQGKRQREAQKELSSKTLTDWELKCMKDKSVKSQETMQPPVQTTQHIGDTAKRNEMWTPALDRRSLTETKLKLRPDDWEIETPYISRSSKASSVAQTVAPNVLKMTDTVTSMKTDLKISSQPKTKALFPSAAHAANMQPYIAQSYINSEVGGSRRMPPPKDFIVPNLSSLISGYKKSERNESTKEEKKSKSKHDEEASSSSRKSGKDKKEKKKKKKKRKRASSSESEHASDTDDSDVGKKKESQERAMRDSEEQCKLLEKKNELRNRVLQLEIEREKLEKQREDIVQNHKGDRKSLWSILEDNSNLTMEIHKQIFSMNEMIRKVNDALGAAGMGKDRHSSSLSTLLNTKVDSIKEELLGSVTALQTSKELPSPLAVQIKYVDHGMHWCQLCGIFCNTFTGFIEHLESPSHMENGKREKKTWLAKAAKPEKDRIAPNAQTITEPLQGTEFVHSLQVFYCSLCDLFLRTKKEAILHPETKQHVIRYKAHTAKNPMYEANFMKAKLGPYAAFKINQEKQRREAFEAFIQKEKAPEKDVKEEATEKRCKESREEIRKEGRRREDERGDDGDSREYRSIRVASRGPVRKRDRDEDERRREERDRKKKDHSYREDKGRRDHEDRKGHDRRKQDRGRGERASKNDTPSPQHSRHSASKRENSAANKNTESDRRSEKTANSEKEHKDENRLTPTPATKSKLPLIGKMPFFKKKGSTSAAKEKGLEKDDDESEGTVVKQETDEGVDSDKKGCSSEAASPDSVIAPIKPGEGMPLKSDPHVSVNSEGREGQEKGESVVKTVERETESVVGRETSSTLKDEQKKDQSPKKKKAKKGVKEKSDLESVRDVKDAVEGMSKKVQVQEKVIPSKSPNKRGKGGDSKKEKYRAPAIVENKENEDEKDTCGGVVEKLREIKETETSKQSSTGNNIVEETAQVVQQSTGETTESNMLLGHQPTTENGVGAVKENESERIIERAEEEVPQPYPSVMPLDFYSGEELAQDDGSGFYQFEDGTMCMEDYTMMDMNSLSAMGLHADPLSAASYTGCSMMPPTSMGMGVDPSVGMYSVHHMGGHDPSCALPEDPLFPPGTEPHMAGESEDVLEEVPMDTEEEPQEPYGDISDTLKHIGQSDHFDKLEEMKLLGIDIDDVAAT